MFVCDFVFICLIFPSTKVKGTLGGVPMPGSRVSCGFFQARDYVRAVHALPVIAGITSPGGRMEEAPWWCACIAYNDTDRKEPVQIANAFLACTRQRVRSSCAHAFVLCVCES